MEYALEGYTAAGHKFNVDLVLILVLMEYALEGPYPLKDRMRQRVLILVLMEYALEA